MDLNTTLTNNQNSIFFKTPEEISANSIRISSRFSTGKIDALMNELIASGPFVATGTFGPDFYSASPFALKNKFCDKTIYGWKPDSPRPSRPFLRSHVIVLGSRKIKERAFIYFVMCNEKEGGDLISEFKPSKEDQKVYIISHKKFQEFLIGSLPTVQKKDRTKESFFVESFLKTTFFDSSTFPTTYGVSSRPQKKPQLSKSEQEYVSKLTSIQPLDSILDRGEVQKKCKEIGQEIFDKYKRENGGNSFAGKDAAQRICNAVLFSCSDGQLRKQYIEHAWNGIGDKNWNWIF